MAKAYTSLHRAQSFKTEELPVSQVFRPSELISGDLIGKGFFGDVVKVSCRATQGYYFIRILANIERMRAHLRKWIDAHPIQAIQGTGFITVTD